MDKDRGAGSAKQIKGGIKEVIGNATGDAKLQSQGKADKIEGKVQKPPAPAKYLVNTTISVTAPAIAWHYVDPAAEAMSQNHNLSPPIHPRRN